MYRPRPHDCPASRTYIALRALHNCPARRTPSKNYHLPKRPFESQAGLLMATRRDKLPGKARDVVTIYGEPGGDADADIAQAYLRPTVQAGSTVRAYNKGKDGSGPSVDALIVELQRQIALVADGDLR